MSDLPRIADLHGHEPTRHHRDVIADDGLLVDLSRTHLSEQTWSGLFADAAARGVLQRARAMFEGAPINHSEGRAVLHTAMRGPHAGVTPGRDIAATVASERQRMLAVAEAVRSGQRTGITGQPFTDLVNIGIGGSHLGPALAVAALGAASPVRVHFLANVDGHAVASLLAGLNAETTLFAVTSKSFGTQETLANATTVRDWLTRELPQSGAVARHMLAISSRADRVAAFGMDPEEMLPMQDWVGGRYSLWSAVGLPIAVAIGASAFEQFLSGARGMDEHFLIAAAWDNLPLRMGLLSYWYRTVAGAQSWAVIPYDERLALLPEYLQQLVMESNGKSRQLDGGVATTTSPVVWGGVGTNVQHAFFQYLHQGTDLTPVELVGVAEPAHSHHTHHEMLLANLLGQAVALATGDDQPDDRHIPGNRPAITVLLRRLDAASLGRLLALHEHRTFVEGVMWNINSFDQFGVELGKRLADGILPALRGDDAELDATTARLVRWLRQD